MKALNGSVCEPDMAQGQWTTAAATDLVKMLLIIVFRPFTKKSKEDWRSLLEYCATGMGSGLMARIRTMENIVRTMSSLMSKPSDLSRRLLVTWI